MSHTIVSKPECNQHQFWVFNNYYILLNLFFSGAQYYLLIANVEIYGHKQIGDDNTIGLDKP